MKKTDQYYIIYERDETGGYIASVPAISGCAIYGETLREAHQNIRWAIKECMEVFYEFHKKIPKETVFTIPVRSHSSTVLLRIS